MAKPATSKPAGSPPRPEACPRQGDIYLADLARSGRQPVLVVSPDEMNRVLSTVIVAPLTSTNRDWPTRCMVSVREKPRSVALDQIRCLSVKRLSRRMGQADAAPARRILQAMFG